MEDGIYLPNKFVRITLEALQEVVGAGAMKAIYHHAGIQDLGENLPADDMNCDFASSDFSRMFNSLSEVMGQRGGRSLAIRAGRATMKLCGLTFGTSPLPKTPPILEAEPDLLFVRLNRLSNFLNSISDMRTLVCKREGQHGFEFLIRQCPNCYQRTSPEPVCGFFEGLLDQAVKDFSVSEKYLVAETDCKASGAPGCKFLISRAIPDTTVSNPPEQT